METDSGESYWQRFTQLVAKLQNLQLLRFFADHVVAEVVHSKVGG